MGGDTGSQTSSGNIRGSHAVIPPPLLEALAAARSVVVATGAGVSAGSGIATFRDRQSGLWSKYRPEDIATPEAFARNPVLVWDWYQWRRKRLSEVQPNAGHDALAEMERLLPGLTLVTQNVDGLHGKAGSRNIVEFHGNIRRNRCVDEGTLSEWDPRTTERPPRCETCGAYLRPDVVWFGEALDKEVLKSAFEAAGRCDVFLSVGTSSVVEPAASLAIRAAGNGAFVAEINPESTPLTASAQAVLRGPSEVLLPALLDALRAIKHA